MANIYEGVMNYEPTKARGWRPEAAPRVWDTLWGEAVAPNGGEEEEVVVEAPITDVDNISKIKNLWNDLKTDFVKGKDEATAKAVLNNLYDIESGIWGSPEERRVNNPWVDPDSVVPNTQQFVNQPGSDTPWTNPDYVAPAETAWTPTYKTREDWVNQPNNLTVSALPEPVDDSVSGSVGPESLWTGPEFFGDASVGDITRNKILDLAGITYPEPNAGPFVNVPAADQEEGLFRPPPEDDDADERLALDAERIRNEQARRKIEQDRIRRLEVKRRQDEQAARNLQKQEAQLRTQRNLEELMAKTRAQQRERAGQLNKGSFMGPTWQAGFAGPR